MHFTRKSQQNAQAHYGKRDAKSMNLYVKINLFNLDTAPTWTRYYNIKKIMININININIIRLGQYR